MVRGVVEVAEGCECDVEGRQPLLAVDELVDRAYAARGRVPMSDQRPDVVAVHPALSIVAYVAQQGGDLVLAPRVGPLIDRDDVGALAEDLADTENRCVMGAHAVAT